MKRISIFFALLTSSIFLNGQVLEDSPKVNIVSMEKRVDNFIVIQVTINGKQLNMLVDTGATTSVLTTKTAKNLKSLTKSKTKKISDGLRTIPTEVKKYDVQIGTDTFKKIAFHIFEEVKTNLLLGVDGIIGVNLLRKMPFKVTTETITFSEKVEYLLQEKKAPSLFLRKYKNILKVHGKIGEEWATNAILVDLGSNTLLTIGNNTRVHKSKRNTKKYKSTFGIGKSYEKLLSSNNDFDTTELILAPKFSFTHIGKKKRYNRIKYDELYLPIIHTNNPDFGGTLGNEILDYYDLIFDIKKGDFYPLQKDSTYNKPNYETFGLGIIPGDTTRVGIIWENSPAYKTSLKSGFIVNSLNAIDLNHKSKLSLKEKYDAIVRTLEIETEITLKYLDDSGIEQNLILKKEPLF